MHGDITDEQWALIADLVAPYWVEGKMGRPPIHDRRDIVNAIFYVTSTGCQWRALPAQYPNWNTVHRLHLAWSRDGTWSRVCARLVAAARESEGKHADASVGIVDARSVRGAATVCGETRGYDSGKKISGRKTFAVVDTLGLLIAVVVFAASTSDNTGGIGVAALATKRSGRLVKVFCDAGFKRSFVQWCRHRHLGVEVVHRVHPHQFVALPKRWIVERSWSWLMNNRRLQIDYERDPAVTAGFYWAAESHRLLRKLAPA